MSLNTTIYTNIKAVEELTGEGHTTRSVFDDVDPYILSSGTGSGAADLKFSIIETVGTSGTTHDLNALVDGDGRTINMVKVKAILVIADAANTNTIVVGNAATNQFQGPLSAVTETITLPAGGRMLLMAPVSGWACTNGASDKLKVAGGAASQTYTMKIIGTSA